MLRVIVPMALATACSPGGDGVISDERQLRMERHGLALGGMGSVENGGLVLAGATVCPRIEPEPSDAAPASCFRQEASGSGVLDDDGCFTLGPGPEVAEWSFVPLDPPVEEACAGLDLVPDRFSFQPVSSDEITASVSAGPLLWAVLLEHARGEPLPDGFALLPALPADEPAALLAGRPTELLVSLTDAEQRPVAIALSGASVLVDERRPARGGLPAAIVDDDRLSPTVTVGHGALAGLSLSSSGDARWDLVEVEGVGPADLASLDVEIAFVESSDPEGFQAPLAALAIVRHRDGRRVFGVPVQWEVTRGRLALGHLWPGGGAAGDVLSVVDACHRPPLLEEDREATLRATYQGLVAEEPLRWRVPAGDPNDVQWPLPGVPLLALDEGSGFTEPPECQGPEAPLSCSNAPVGQPFVTLLGLLALVGARGRARARRRSPSRACR